VTEEARLEQLTAGLTPVTEGWFVVNVRDAAWVTNDTLGSACTFEGDGTPPFGEVGYTLGVLQPGVASGLYHRESNQEDFLVLAGECLAIVEGQERALKAWDLLHCPAWTKHAFVGAGDGPCAILMVGARHDGAEADCEYPVDPVAQRHGAGVATATTSPDEAYAGTPESVDVPYREGTLPGA
jgi:uncharacterized cupin superfamily protein